MADFNSLPAEASPALADNVFTARGAAAGAERRTAWQAVRDLFKTFFDTIYLIKNQSIAIGPAATPGTTFSRMRMGTGSLFAGSSIIEDTTVTSNSLIFLTSQADTFGTPGQGLRVLTRTAGVSFTVQSGNSGDGNTFAWLMIQP